MDHSKTKNGKTKTNGKEKTVVWCVPVAPAEQPENSITYHAKINAVMRRGKSHYPRGAL